MKTIATKYKIQDDTNYPHIGTFLRTYFTKNHINRAELSRKMNVSTTATARYMNQESLQFGILWKISIALNRNLIADLASRLPIPFTSARERELEKELQTLQQEMSDLKIENRTYKSLLSNK
jgi:transcriptional regulator with XRE-family HTH domain